MSKIDFKARYFVMQNRDGRRIVVDRFDRMHRYRKMARAFVNYTQFNGFVYYKHITLTQAIESYKPNLLNNFFNKVRRYYGDIAYIWTAEIQEERLEKYNEAVLHWHVIVGFLPGTDIDSSEIARLQRYWRYGNLDIRSIKRLNLSYILKYITKSLNNSIHKVRRISMSRIPLLYRHFKSNIIKCIEWAEYNLERLFGFYRVDSKGIYYRYFDDLFQKWRKDYMLLLNSWRLVGSFDGEPF